MIKMNRLKKMKNYWRRIKMGNKDVFQVLKNLSLVDLITIIAENSDIVVQEKSSNEVYYTAKELIKLYPNIFSKYKIDKYIK